MGEEHSLSIGTSFGLIRDDRFELLKFRLWTFPVNTPPYELSSSVLEFSEMSFNSLLSCWR